MKREIENHKRVGAALKSSEEKYRSLVESTKDSIFLVDKDCNYLFMNSKHRKKLGLTSSDINHAAYAAFHTKIEIIKLLTTLVLWHLYGMMEWWKNGIVGFKRL